MKKDLYAAGISLNQIVGNASKRHVPAVVADRWFGGSIIRFVSVAVQVHSDNLGGFAVIYKNVTCIIRIIRHQVVGGTQKRHVTTVATERILPRIAVSDCSRTGHGNKLDKGCDKSHVKRRAGFGAVAVGGRDRHGLFIGSPRDRPKRPTPRAVIAGGHGADRRLKCHVAVSWVGKRAGVCGRIPFYQNHCSVVNLDDRCCVFNV